MSGKIKYQYPFYSDSVRPKGFLTFDRKTHALFHYYLMCQKLLERAGNSIEDQRFRLYEGQAWADKPYANIAKSTALIYQLDSPADFLHSELKDLVRLEIARMGFPPPHPEYWDVGPDTLVEV